MMSDVYLEYSDKLAYGPVAESPFEDFGLTKIGPKRVQNLFVLCYAKDGAIHYATMVLSNPGQKSAHKDAVVSGPFEDKLIYLEDSLGCRTDNDIKYEMKKKNLSPQEIENVQKAKEDLYSTRPQLEGDVRRTRFFPSRT